MNTDVHKNLALEPIRSTYEKGESPRWMESGSWMKHRRRYEMNNTNIDSYHDLGNTCEGGVAIYNTGS